MSNAQDPFEMDDGFEGIPVVQKPVQAVNKVANTVVKQTAQQVKATTKAFISQLYGSSSTDDDQQADATVDPMAQVQKTQSGQAHTPLPQQATHHASSSQSAQSDQNKLEQTRRELQQTHRSSYYLPTFGDIGHLESEIQKEAQKRQQEEQQKEQEEEQEKQQMQQLEEQKKQETPLAVKQARTKSERRPGAG